MIELEKLGMRIAKCGMVVVAVVLCGCAAPAPSARSNPFQYLRQRCIEEWGPENTWTPQQNAIFRQAEKDLLAAALR